MHFILIASVAKSEQYSSRPSSRPIRIIKQKMNLNFIFIETFFTI